MHIIILIVSYTVMIINNLLCGKPHVLVNATVKVHV